MKNITEKGSDNNWTAYTYYRYWKHMVHHDIPAHFGLRNKDYKLVFYYGCYTNLEKEGTLSMYWNNENNSNKELSIPVAWEFYDLRKDPQELKNEYNNSEYKDVIEKMKLELKAERKRLKEEDNEYPLLKEIIDAHWND